jgi:hypothetical protein
LVCKDNFSNRWKGANGVKRLLSGLFFALLLGGTTLMTWAAATTPDKGEAAVLFGNEDAGWVNYQINEGLQVFINSDEEDFARAGLSYRLNECFGVKAGMTYDNIPADSNHPTVSGQSKFNPFGEFNWSLPVGNNTRFIGKYDYDYFGKDWQTYEAFIRVEIFPRQYVHAGVRGDMGDGAAEYDLYKANNEAADNKEMMIFIRGDFGWQWKRFSLKLRPLLYVYGTWLHDYDLAYQINDKMSVLFNMNSLYDKEEKYRLGLQFQF